MFSLYFISILSNIFHNDFITYQLSPKKTMEGYIGGGLLTVILGTAFTRLCVEYGYPSLICPAEANHNYFSSALSAINGTHSTNSQFLFTPECKIPDVFLPQTYQVCSAQISLD